MKTLFALLLLIGSYSFAQEYPDDCLDNLEIPESYSPNGDGMNDVFRIDFPCPPEEFSIKIYNRWGEEVYSSDDHKFQWDGTKDDKPLAEGVYIWALEFTFNGGEFKKNGNMSILR